ncbi:JmjC domain-containing protein [Pseudomonas fluorescens]|uniref:JmjC domain-containing protein n=1 Tax=Pseudomonas fluorescens TaxID=294 RepID=UPI003F9B7A93
MNIKFNITKDDFFKKHQEISPVIIKNAVPKNFITWKDANEIFHYSDASSEDLKLLLNGLIPKSQYVEKYLEVGTVYHRLIKPIIYEYLKKGATLVANKIKHSEKANQLSRQISLFTERQVVSSAYVALGNIESTPCHWDTRDVFAIQLIGRKKWTLYEPSMDSPVFTQQSKDYKDLHPCPTNPHMEIILDEGDILYIPRGWWHNPVPLGEPTFHLSVGTFPALAMDYLSWLAPHVENIVESRKSLSQWTSDFKKLSTLGARITQLLESPTHYEKFLDEFTGATRVDSPLALELFGVSQTITLPDNLSVRICANQLRNINCGYVIANGARLTIDSKNQNLLMFLAKTGGSRIDQIKINSTDALTDDLNKTIIDLCRLDILELVNLQSGQ